MCPGIFGYRGTLLYILCDVISITCELGVVFRVNEISRSKPLHCSIPCILMRTFMSDWYKIRRTYRVRTFSWRLDERIIVCSVPRNDGAEGSFGRMKMESVHPGHWEERTRDEVLVPVDDCIRWHDHERIKRSLGWMSPVQYRQSQGTAA